MYTETFSYQTQENHSSLLWGHLMVLNYKSSLIIITLPIISQNGGNIKTVLKSFF